MKYLKITLFVLALALAGAGCRLQPPQAIDSDSISESDSLTEIQKENERLNQENKILKRDVDEAKEKLDEKDSDDPWYADATEEEIEEIKKERAETEYPTNDRGREIISEANFSNDMGDKRINIFLVTSEVPHPAQSESPAFRFGCDDYLYPATINLEEDKTQSDLATAIVQLLTYKPDAESAIENSVRGKGFILTYVKYEDGIRVVELEGDDITTAGVCEDARIKAQIEETVAAYTNDNFTIMLNGSAKEWESLFSGQE